MTCWAGGSAGSLNRLVSGWYKVGSVATTLLLEGDLVKVGVLVGPFGPHLISSEFFPYSKSPPIVVFNDTFRLPDPCHPDSSRFRGAAGDTSGGFPESIICEGGGGRLEELGDRAL